MNVYWLTGPYIENKNGTLDSEVASVRYRLLMPAQVLAKNGLQSNIYVNTESITKEIQASSQKTKDNTLVIFSKPNNLNEKMLLQTLNDNGVSSIVDVCDNHFNAEMADHYKYLCQHASQVTVPSHAMAAVVKHHTNREAIVIPDPVEGKQIKSHFIPRSPLKLLWFGHPSNLQQLFNLFPSLNNFAKNSSIKMTILTKDVLEIRNDVEVKCAKAYKNIKFEFIDWSKNAQQQSLKNCDMVIIPSLNSEKTRAKSSNRVIESIRAGRPVVAYPLPAYIEFEKYIVLNENIIDGIEIALQNQNNMLNRIDSGQKYIRDNYDISLVGKLWNDTILKTLNPEKNDLSELNS